jgi:multisubunit Na+/H+ antiporter MnhE subunit
VLCAALWLALVDRVPVAELITGVVAAGLGASAAVLVRQQRRTVTRPSARWLRDAWRPVIALGGDLWPLLRALVLHGILRRGGASRIHTFEFAVGAHAPREAAFGVMTAMLGSLGPNTIVLDIDDDARVLYAHQLVPTPDARRSAMPLDGP